MPFRKENIQGTLIMVSTGREVFISSTEEVLDVLSLGGEQGTSCFIFHESNFPAGFYDLKTGLAGEILQKFSTYRIRVAIVGDFSEVSSKRFREFMYECNRGQQLHFMENEAQALEWISHRQQNNGRTSA